MPQPAPVRNSPPSRRSVAGRNSSAGTWREGGPHRRQPILDTATAGPVNGPLLRTPAGSAGPAGAVAQLGERRNRTAEVRGSNPLSSTKASRCFLEVRDSKSYLLQAAEGKATPQGAPEGNADRAQGLGHRVRKGQLTPCLCRMHHRTIRRLYGKAEPFAGSVLFARKMALGGYDALHFSQKVRLVAAQSLGEI